MDCLPARCRCGTSTDKNTHREEPVRRSAAPVRHRPSAVGNEPKRDARRPCTITQRLGAEEGDTPVEQQPAAMQDFDPTYDRCGSSASGRPTAQASGMSAVLPIASELLRRSETSLRAISSPTGGAPQRRMRGWCGNNDSFLLDCCSTSSASLCQVRAMSIRMDRILKFAARSAIRSHSIECCRHSTGVIIVAFMTPRYRTEARPQTEFTPYIRPESSVGHGSQGSF
jgi:hypothetical protein